ncbi:MAG: hypothetical protein ACYSUY_10255 [Planctomycetota bacterium]|jgi:hypothetical protein
MNSNEDNTTVEFSPLGEKGVQAIALAKKAIESVRNDISCNNALPACRKCGVKHPPFHSCGGAEKTVKSKELTKKVIELFCGNISTKKPMPKCEPGDKNHQPLYPRSVESEKKTKIPVATINRTDEKGQAEAKSTELPGVSIKTATCQCCDSEGIEATYLYKIDSGQLLCPDCLKSLRDAATYKTVPHR